MEVNDRSPRRTQLAVFKTYWKDMLFFDSVVHCEMMAELFRRSDELPNRHSSWSLVSGTGLVEHLPSCAEMRVKVIHALCHTIIYLKVSGRHLLHFWFRVGHLVLWICHCSIVLEAPLEW